MLLAGLYYQDVTPSVLFHILKRLEAVAQRRSVKKVFLENSQNSESLNCNTVAGLRPEN